MSMAFTRKVTLPSPLVAPLPSGRSPASAALPACISRGPGCTTPLPRCDVTNTRLPHTIGDEMPRPSSGAFQAMFSVSLQRSGRFCSALTPDADGPRQCGQLSAASVALAAKTIPRIRRMLMGLPSHSIISISTSDHHFARSQGGILDRLAALGDDGMAVTSLVGNLQAAEVCLPSIDFAADLAFYTDTLGFRLDTIFPADDPAVATLSGHGLRIRLERGSTAAAPTLRLLCHDPGGLANGARELKAPGGVRILIVDAAVPLEIPPTEHAFIVRRLKDNTPWVIGRA